MQSPEDLERELGVGQACLVEHARVVEPVTGWPLLVGNAVEMLIDGDETYPAMIDAIRSACSSISLMSYIFEATGGGGELVDVLVEAREWGVEVQVLIDDAGTRYARP
jgi:cardiolipin synthase